MKPNLKKLTQLGTLQCNWSAERAEEKGLCQNVPLKLAYLASGVVVMKLTKIAGFIIKWIDS